jgi:predicted membrane-bound spermidine synthase
MASWRPAWILFNAFIVGGVLMGFEMLSSRYLYPYFGGGIGTWAGLISTILLALAIGYFVGGAVVDWFPSPLVIAAAIAVSAIYLALIPAAADDVIHEILRRIGDGPAGIITASSALLLIPMSLLGMFSPVSLRLIIRSTDEAGRWAGLIYGISTLGSVCGTLTTTFALIPTIGSRAITYLFAGLLGFSALGMTLLRERRE